MPLKSIKSPVSHPIIPFIILYYQSMVWSILYITIYTILYHHIIFPYILYILYHRMVNVSFTKTATATAARSLDLWIRRASRSSTQGITWTWAENVAIQTGQGNNHSMCVDICIYYIYIMWFIYYKYKYISCELYYITLYIIIYNIIYICVFHCFSK